MILKTSNYLVSIILLFSVLHSQSEIDDLINEVYSGNINNAKAKLPAMKREFSDIPSLLFLDAFIRCCPILPKQPVIAKLIFFII